ncbi:MAG: glycosyltransferase [bacterium]
MESFKLNLERKIESREKSNFSDLIIYTTTLYKSDEMSAMREKLALSFFKKIEKLNIKCVVVDGGSNVVFLENLQQISNLKIISDNSQSMGGSRRLALDEALKTAEAKYFLWVEPEKDDLISEESLSRLIDDLRNNNTDVVVAKREALESMPKLQAWLEDRANKRAMETAGVTVSEAKEVWDLWFGPKMFNREAAKYFMASKSSLDKWDTIIKPVIEAFQDGKKIANIVVDYKYDITQKSSEENSDNIKRKRLTQYVNILAELGDNYWKDKI